MTDLTMGQRIAECRKRLGLSQEALGEKAGVSRQAISKWESDSTVPEIDKLIALSRLFNVSVGWLLGVEETPEPKGESPEISEELLRKIEQIVLRCRPRKEKLSAGKMILIGIAAALVLWSGWHLLEEWSITRNEVGYLSAQIRNNNEQNSNILNQLDTLEDRIDSINDTIEREGAVLAAYEFQITAVPGEDTAFVYLNAVPKTWNESWTATLSVRHDGSQSMSQTCTWDGSALISSLKLNLLDGYECWLVISYPDGGQEQVRLENREIQELKSSLSITCQGNFGDLAAWSLDDHYVTLKVYDVHLQRPVILGDSEESYWTNAEFVLYHVRGEARTLTDRKSILHEGVKDDIEFWYEGTLSLTIPDIEAGDRLELWIDAELANGIACSQKIAAWEYQRPNGFVLTDR